MGGRFINASGASRREIAKACLESRLAVTASGAKQSIFLSVAAIASLRSQ